MSAEDGIDHARGWLFVEGLLLEDKVARLEGLDGAELEAELRADGVDPARVPGVEQLVARAASKAKQAPERTEVDHVRGWAFVEGLPGGEDEQEGARKVPSLQRLIARAEELAREEARGVQARAVEARAPEVARPGGERAKARWRGVWLVAAALGLMLLVFAALNGAAIVAFFKGEEIRPDDPWLPWKPAPAPEQRAARLRNQAFKACREQRWSACEAELDEARRLDPAGESAAPVVEARKAIVEGKAPEPVEGPKGR